MLSFTISVGENLPVEVMASYNRNQMPPGDFQQSSKESSERKTNFVLVKPIF
jgi:hypothetical protein